MSRLVFNRNLTGGKMKKNSEAGYFSRNRAKNAGGTGFGHVKVWLPQQHSDSSAIYFPSGCATLFTQSVLSLSCEWSFGTPSPASISSASTGKRQGKGRSSKRRWLN